MASSDYKKLYNVFVGAETGLLKGVNGESGNWNNITSVEKADKNKEIVCLCWNDDLQNELCIGRRDQTVSIFSTSAAITVDELKLTAGEGPFKGISRIGSDYLTCTQSGCLRLWSRLSDCKLELNVGDNVCSMRNNPTHLNLVATGGKENELKIWNLNDVERPIFTAKNVANDWLNLRVPVWVTDVCFLPDSQQVVTCTNYHQVRLYDPASGKRRPQLEVVFDECPIKSMSLRPNLSHQIIVGNSHGGMALIDLRGKGSVVQRYKGAEGGIRAVACHPTEDVVLSCGLDRYLRIHDINSRHLIRKLYLKSRLNCMIISNKLTSADDSEDADITTSEMVCDEADEASGECDDTLWSTMAKVKTRGNAEDQIVSKNQNVKDVACDVTKKSDRKRKRKSIDDASAAQKTKTKPKVK